MKIAMICPSYYPYIGGVETFVKNISEGLERQGVEVEVLSQDPQRKFPSEEVINGVHIKRFKTGFLGWDYFFAKNSLRAYLKDSSYKYDVVHAHSYHAFPALFAAWSKSRNKLVINAHYHGKGHNWLMSFLHLAYRPIGKVIFERADKIICHTQFERTLLQRDFHIDSRKFVIIPSIVNIKAVEEAQPFDHEDKLLLYVGRLERYKNVHLIIQAISYLPEDYYLLIIGSGPFKPSLLRQIKNYKLTTRVHILSGLPNEQVYKWYKTCDFVINLSSQEAFGLTVVEGLAAGKPVVVSNQMALAEIANKYHQISAVDIIKFNPKQLAEIITSKTNIDISLLDLSEYSQYMIANRIKDLYDHL